MSSQPHDDDQVSGDAARVRAVDADTLAAWALDALDDNEREAIDYALANDANAARHASALLDVVTRLTPIETTADAPAASRLLSGALAARRAGRSLASPAEGATLPQIHDQIAENAAAFVRTLTAHDLERPTRLGHTVGEVIAHLVGQLERTATELGDGTFPTFADDEYEHWQATSSYRERLARADGPALAAALTAVNNRIAARLRDLDGSETLGDVHTIGSLAGRCLGKSFELWMHIADARLALGRPATTPDAAAMLTICTFATEILPYGMAATGNAQPGKTLRVVLTGPGGGTWLCSLAPAEAARGDADALLVADAATFCRLFHRQVTAEAVPAAIEGDRDIVDAALAGAQAFAERT